MERDSYSLYLERHGIVTQFLRAHRLFSTEMSSKLKMCFLYPWNIYPDCEHYGPVKSPCIAECCAGLSVTGSSRGGEGFGPTAGVSKNIGCSEMSAQPHCLTSHKHTISTSLGMMSFHVLL